jgi:hypothetical protein
MTGFQAYYYLNANYRIYKMNQNQLYQWFTLLRATPLFPRRARILRSKV